MCATFCLYTSSRTIRPRPLGRPFGDNPFFDDKPSLDNKPFPGLPGLDLLCLGAPIQGRVRTARFTAFNDRKAELEAAGVKLNGVNATVAQVLEPEYTTFSQDERIAFVSLQVRGCDGQ